MYNGPLIPQSTRIIIGGKHANKCGYSTVVGEKAIIIHGDRNWFTLTGASDDGIEYRVRTKNSGTWCIRKDDCILLGINNKEMKDLLERDY